MKAPPSPTKKVPGKRTQSPPRLATARRTVPAGGGRRGVLRRQREAVELDVMQSKKAEEAPLHVRTYCPVGFAPLPVPEESVLRCISKHGELEYDHFRVTRSKLFPSCVPTEVFLASGRYYFEVRLQTGTAFRVGWASPDQCTPVGTTDAAGDDDHSWAYDGVRQVLLHGGRAAALQCSRWAPGDTVGVAADLDAGLVRFHLNGRPLPVPPEFSSIRVGAGRSVAPVVSLGAGASCELVFDQAKFLPRHRADDPARPLFEAAAAGELEALENLLSTYNGAGGAASPSATGGQDDGHQQELAAQHKTGAKDLVNRLRAAADVVTSDETLAAAAGDTLLVTAARCGRAETVRWLLDGAGASPDEHVGRGGETALIAAASAGHTATCAVLVGREAADLEARDVAGNTALLAAARHGSLDTVRMLVATGADVSASNEDGETALVAAVASLRADRMGLVRLLLDEAGLDPDEGTADEQGTTALMLAARGGSVELVRLLVARGADPARQTASGDTALLAAAGQGRLAVVQALVNEAGADPYAENASEETALTEALREGHVDVAAWLLSIGHPRMVGRALTRVSAIRSVNDVERLYQVCMASVRSSENTLAASMQMAGWFHLLARRMRALRADFEERAAGFSRMSVRLWEAIESEDLCRLLVASPGFLDSALADREFVRSPRLLRIMHGFWRPQGSTKWYLKSPFKLYREPRTQYVLDVVSYAVFVAVVSLFALQHPPLDAPVSGAEYLLYAFGAGFLLREIGEFREAGARLYLRQASNQLDILIVATVGALAGCRARTGLDGHPVEVPVYVASATALAIVAWARSIFYLSLSERMGPLLIIIQKMMRDVVALGALLLVFLAGFFFSVYFLLDGDVSLGGFGSYGGLVSTLVVSALTGNDLGPFEGLSAAQESVALALVPLFALLTTVMLVNILLAMMASTYAKVEERSREEYLRMRLTTYRLYDQNMTVAPPPVNFLIWLAIPILYPLRRLCVWGEPRYCAHCHRRWDKLDSRRVNWEALRAAQVVSWRTDDIYRQLLDEGQLCECLRLKKTRGANVLLVEKLSEAVFVLLVWLPAYLVLGLVPTVARLCCRQSRRGGPSQPASASSSPPSRTTTRSAKAAAVLGITTTSKKGEKGGDDDDDDDKNVSDDERPRVVSFSHPNAASAPAASNTRRRVRGRRRRSAAIYGVASTLDMTAMSDEDDNNDDEEDGVRDASAESLAEACGATGAGGRLGGAARRRRGEAAASRRSTSATRRGGREAGDTFDGLVFESVMRRWSAGVETLDLRRQLESIAAASGENGQIQLRFVQLEAAIDERMGRLRTEILSELRALRAPPAAGTWATLQGDAESSALLAKSPRGGGGAGGGASGANVKRGALVPPLL